MTGFSPLLPAPALSSLVPVGVPGCSLHVAGDILDITETTNGVLSWEIFVPPIPAIVGVDFWHQMVPIEVDAVGAQVSVTATNALRLTGGSF